MKASALVTLLVAGLLPFNVAQADQRFFPAAVNLKLQFGEDTEVNDGQKIRKLTVNNQGLLLSAKGFSPVLAENEDPAAAKAAITGLRLGLFVDPVNLSTIALLPFGHIDASNNFTQIGSVNLANLNGSDAFHLPDGNKSGNFKSVSNGNLSLDTGFLKTEYEGVGENNTVSTPVPMSVTALVKKVCADIMPPEGPDPTCASNNATFTIVAIAVNNMLGELYVDGFVEGEDTPLQVVGGSFAAKLTNGVVITE